MANVYRIFVEKKKGNDIEAMQILTDLRQNVGITALTGLRLINRYDVQGVSEAEFRKVLRSAYSGGAFAGSRISLWTIPRFSG